MNNLERVRAYWPGAPSGAAEAIADSVDRGGTSVWHEVHRWLVENRPLPSCRVCDGPVAREGDDVHELCRARRARGLPTPRLDATPRCPCARCRPSWES